MWASAFLLSLSPLDASLFLLGWWVDDIIRRAAESAKGFPGLLSSGTPLHLPEECECNSCGMFVGTHTWYSPLLFHVSPHGGFVFVFTGKSSAHGQLSSSNKVSRQSLNP